MRLTSAQRRVLAAADWSDGRLRIVPPVGPSTWRWLLEHELMDGGGYLTEQGQQVWARLTRRRPAPPR